MKQDININIDIIRQSIDWANKYGKESFPYEVFKNYRRTLRRIEDALSENCSAAAYGESQVGKSYLMSSLLSTPDAPFVIENKGKSYSFIDAINPSGGNNTKQESTGVITRFTIRQSNPSMSDFVKVTNLSVVDIILMLTDSYYNDVKINADHVLMKEDIDRALADMSELWRDHVVKNTVIDEDDIRDIYDYVREIIGNNAANWIKSNFNKVIAPVIQYIGTEDWVKVFGLLWNNNPELNRLFNLLVSEYEKLDFEANVYVPFEAVLRSQGTLLKIDWLDSVCGIHNEDTDVVKYTDVYSEDGKVLAKDFSKSFLSALIGELTFVLPESIAKERKFLKKIDLLDFPGARSREKIKEEQLGDVLPTILRRGKVAYLFNKYSRSLKISSVLFCHHNDQKTEATIGSSIYNWIRDNIGETPAQRAEVLRKTNGIAPLFMVCTKFNIDLDKTKNDTKETANKLDNHWARFNTTIPKIIEPEKWFDEWVPLEGIFTSRYFQNVYLLRDYYWSSKNQLFDGYSESEKTPEQAVHQYPEYPDYFMDLHDSFVANSFVRKHFANPEQAWNDVATINNDGSKSIIRNLDAIAEVLEEARRTRYQEQLEKIREEVLGRLSVYYESEDKEQNNRKTRQIVGDIKLKTEFLFGERPELFGEIIDNLMVSSADLRDLAYNIIVRHTEEPKGVSSVKMVRALSGIDIDDDRDTNIRKLCVHYNKEESELKAFFSEMGVSLEDVISDETELLATVPDVIAKQIIEYWCNHINEKIKTISDILPHSEETAFMMITLLRKLGVNKIISDKINQYYSLFSPATLPNAIADFSALTLNNFVSTVGRQYMDDSDLDNIRQKANACHLEIDLNPLSCESEARTQPLLDVLKALDQSRDEMNNTHIDMNTLKKLPFWDNYRKWQNFVTIGLLYASDISQVDPVANSAMKLLIDQTERLYK